jgi:glycolate oxidase FAD binding subunit
MPIPPHTATTLRPRTTAELAELLRERAASAHRILVKGRGTAFDWGGRAEPADILVEMTAMTGVLRHDPEDMTVAVHAGTRLDALLAVLGEHGQRASIDPSRTADGATVGGLVATADAGPLRQAFGSLRGLVIGVTFVLPDGTVVHSGGQVIKNVAGYDLGKLLHGSLGTLGILTEVVLRLHPLPASVATVVVPCGPAEAVRIGRALVGGAVEPAALEWADGRLHVRLEGTQVGTAAGARRAVEIAGGGETLDGSAADAAWDRLTRVARAGAGDTVVRIGTSPSDSAWLIDRVCRIAERHGTDVELASSVGVGVHTVRLRRADPGRHSGLLDDLRQDLPAGKGTAVIIRPEGLEPGAPTRGRPPSGVEIMRAIKNRFDPDGRLGAGRFAPWF